MSPVMPQAIPGEPIQNVAAPIENPQIIAPANKPTTSFNRPVPSAKQPFVNNKPITPEDKFKGLVGVNIQVFTLLQHICMNPYKISVSILEGPNQLYVQPNNQPAVSLSQIYIPPPPGTAMGLSAKKPLSAAGMQMQNKKSLQEQKAEQEQRMKMATEKAPPIQIDNEFNFSGNLYQRRSAMLQHPGFYLVIEVAEKGTSNPNLMPGNPEDDFKTVVYTTFDLIDKQTGLLRTGKFTAQLYRAPVIIPPAIEPLIGKIAFSVNEMRIAQPPKPPTAKIAQPAAQIPIPQENNNGPTIYIQNDKPFNSVAFGPKEGFIFYLDGMRFIPEACGPIKVNLRGYYCNLERFLPETLFYPDPNSTVSMPIYKAMKFQFVPNINPTAVLIASLEVYDDVSSKDKILGYIAMNLFVDAVTNLPVKDIKAQNFKLLEGGFQIPIYCESPISPPITFEKM